MELSKIVFGDSILPVFGVEKSQLVKNTTQESGYSPTFLSKYHIGDVVTGKILENLGNGKGTFAISGTVLAGYMPEYLMPNDVLSFQLQRSQSGEVALLLHSIPNSYNEKTRFSPSQIASLLGIDSEDDAIFNAIQTLKNTGQPITKDAIYSLLRLVEEVRAKTYLKQQSTDAILLTIEDMFNEGVPLSAKNISLFTQSVGAIADVEQSIRNLLQNGRVPETVELRQSILHWATSLLPILISTSLPKESTKLSQTSVEQLREAVNKFGAKYFNYSESISATFSSLFSGHLSKAEEKIAVFELNKQLLQFLLSHSEIDKEDALIFLNEKQSMAIPKNSTNEKFKESLQSLHALFLKYLAKPETTTIDLHIQEQQLQTITPKILLFSESFKGFDIESSLDQFIRMYENKENAVFQQREHLHSIVKQLFTLADNKQLPPATKMELLHSILRSEVATSNQQDILPKLLISFLQDITIPQSTVDVQKEKFFRATDMLFQKLLQDTTITATSFQQELQNVFEKYFPNNVRNSFQKELNQLVQQYFNETTVSQENKSTDGQFVNFKEHYQQSYKETVSSAAEVLKNLVGIPERNRTNEQIEAIKNISILLSSLGAFEAFNSVAMEERFPMYLLLPMILEMNKQKRFDLKKIRIERHSATDEKQMLQFGFVVPTSHLSEVNVRGSYLDKRMTLQMYVESISIKKTIEDRQAELMERLQTYGYSVVSMAITTKEQHTVLPPIYEHLKHDWRV